jgi:PKD repeat protein
MSHEQVGTRLPASREADRRAWGRALAIVAVTLVVAVGTLPAPAQAVVTETPLSTDSPDHPVGPFGRVNDIAVIGTTAYIAGDFARVGGMTRNGLAAIDLRTGHVEDWNPNVNGVVDTIVAAPDGSRLYVGGKFSAIGTTTRRRLAAIDAETGRPTSWHPRPSARVKTIDVRGSDVYIGGVFQTVGGVAVPYAAKIDAVTGDADPNWDPRPTSSVNALEVAPDGATVFLAGSFDEIDGENQQHAAEVGATTGALTNWDPNIRQTVIDLDVASDGSRVYFAVGGAGGNGGNLALAVSATSGSTAWSHATSGDVQAVAEGPDRVYFGGHFDESEGAPAAKLLAIRANGQRDTGWDPGVDSPLGVWALTFHGGLLFVGGDFGEIAGAAQPHFAVFATEGQNQPPGADFDWTCDDLACSFDARSSGDTDGTIVDYDWRFGDGTSGANRRTTHTYGAPAAYTVRLTVTDDRGATDSITKVVSAGASPVHVHNLAPFPRDRDEWKWLAIVQVTVRNANEVPVVGAVVEGYFGQGRDANCTTNANGKCKVKVRVKDTKRRIPWTMTDIVAPGGYDPSANHDATGDSDGTVILVWQP